MIEITRNTGKLSLKDFHFSVPASLVAQKPAEKRSAARLLLSSQTRGLQNYYVTDLPSLLPKGCLLVFNDSRVFPGRLKGVLPTGGKAEIFLLRKPEGSPFAEADALGRPFKKLKKGTVVRFSQGVEATIILSREESSGVSLRVRFNLPEEDLLSYAENSGQIPLPPYIKREDESLRSEDKERYQTVYARLPGSVAAPTAGLHWDQDMLASLEVCGMETAKVTLHVGAGTFLPVKDHDIDRHAMHAESFYVPCQSLEKILRARKENRPIVAVGTTSFRCLESLFLRAQDEGREPLSFADRWLSTRLFVRPRLTTDRYAPHVFSGIQTNFHQPESTLFMLICALLGFDRAHDLYRFAIENRYRFYSYGDSSLLWF